MRRRTKVLLFLILFLIGGFFYGKKCQAISVGDVAINEIMWMGSSISTADEWIELKNLTTNSINFSLTPWSIYKNDSLMIVINKGILEKNDYFLISNNSRDHSFTDGKSVLDIDPDFIDTDISLSNSSVQYKLYDALTSAGNLIDTADDGTGTPLTGENEALKKSMERNDDPGIGIKKENWHTCFEPINLDDSASDCATPKAGNSKEPSLPPPVVYSDKIIINELLPKPDLENDLYKEEFVEIYNSGDQSENLDEWYLKDRAGKICNLSGKTIGPEEFLVILNDSANKCVLALNDTQGEFLGLYNPNGGDPVSNVSYEGSAKKGRSYNFNGATWHWSQFLTAGEENIFNNEPYGTLKIDKDIFVNVYADFFVSTNDSDGEEVKVVWDFGDGHKSYLEKTRHKYEQKGFYSGTVKLTDGSEDVIKSFTIEVKKHPEPKIKIVKIKANPKGKDALGEEIYLKNNSKKKINLKTWSIATGSKTLYNHPITKKFVIKPEETKKITRKYSLFTLNNKQGLIELRYPNGEIASRVKYDKKKGTVKDDEVYELSGKKWQWNAPTEEILEENVLQNNTTVSPENPAGLTLETEPEISQEEISLDLGKYSTENKLAYLESDFMPNAKNLLQSRETPGIVLGAFSAHDEIRQPVEIKTTTSWQKTLQKGNWLLNFLINRVLSLI